MITAAQFLRVVGALVRLNFSTGKDRACVRAHLRRCLYTADLQKRLTHTVTHTRKRADGSSGNRDVKEYFNSSENDQKRPENDIFRIFLLFVISRSGVRIRLPAPLFLGGSSAYGGVPEWPKGTDCKSAGNAYGGSNPPAPTKSPHHKMRAFSSIVPAGDSIRAGVNGAPGALQSREAARTAVRANPPAPTKK